MNRGWLSSIASHDAYRHSDKELHANLQQVDCFWFDMVVNPPLGIDAPQPIKLYLTDLKQRVEESLEKRFIYFYGARKKVRFDAQKPLSQALLSGKLCVNVLIGAKGKRRSVPCDLSAIGITNLKRVHCTATDKFLTLSSDGRTWITMSIHDFLQRFDVNLGFSSEVHYVGLTKNPHKRPLGREHRGYADMVYGVGSDENDFFLFVSLFDVMVKASGSHSGLQFLVANATVNDLNVQEEGQLIESGFIAYFDTSYQQLDRKNERAKFEASLQRIAEKNQIKSLTVHFELESPSEYFRLYAEQRKSSDKHAFRCSAPMGSLVLDELNL